MQKQAYTLAQLAELLGAEVRGDSQYLIEGLADLEQAQAAQLSFIASKAYEKYLSKTQAGALLLTPALAEKYEGRCVVLANPYWGYAKLSGLFSQRPAPRPGVHPSAVIDDSAEVPASASIGPNCVIEAGARIGEFTELTAGVYIGADTAVGSHCLLYPNVTVYHGIFIGNKVTVHSSTVIGSDGFGFAPSRSGWEKIHQLGSVVIGNDVEIGAGCTIDRGALNDTIIEDGVIIDNRVHLAHNVKVGKQTAIAGCCGVAGSTEIGAHCLIGGNVNISGHLKIADKVQFNGGATVTRSVEEAGTYASGTPLLPVWQWRRNAVRFSQLDLLYERVKKLESGKSEAAEGDD